MQQRLGVTTRLRHPLNTSSQAALQAIEVSKFHAIFLYSGSSAFLAVHHRCHALKGFLDLGVADDAMVPPVGHVLAADAQDGAVFHQADVVDVGHLCAAHALVIPAPN